MVAAGPSGRLAGGILALGAIGIMGILPAYERTYRAQFASIAGYSVYRFNERANKVR